MGWRKLMAGRLSGAAAKDRTDRSPGSGDILKGKELAAAREIAREALAEDLQAIEIYGPWS